MQIHKQIQINGHCHFLAHILYNYTLLILIIINDSGLTLLRLLVYLILPSTESSLGKAVTST